MCEHGNSPSFLGNDSAVVEQVEGGELEFFRAGGHVGRLDVEAVVDVTVKNGACSGGVHAVRAIERGIVVALAGSRIGRFVLVRTNATYRSFAISNVGVFVCVAVTLDVVGVGVEEVNAVYRRNRTKLADTVLLDSPNVIRFAVGFGNQKGIRNFGGDAHAGDVNDTVHGEPCVGGGADECRCDEQHHDGGN